MTMQSDGLPPPYVPPAARSVPATVMRMTSVPQWILVYAVVGKPLLWLLHRVANGFELYDERGKESFYRLFLAFALWSLVSFVVTAVVYAGGVHGWAKPTIRPRLLRFGLGCSVAWSVLLVAVVILLIEVALAGPTPENNQLGGLGPGDIAAAVAVLLWIASFVCEVIAWRRLGRMHSSTGGR